MARISLTHAQADWLLDVDTAERERVCMHTSGGLPEGLPDGLLVPRGCIGCRLAWSYGLSPLGRELVAAVRAHDTERRTA